MSITANFLKQYVRINRRNSWSRERMLQFQDTQLRELLEYVWEHSQFYHQLYSQAGLSQSDLPTVPLSDLPVVTKEQLMANFDNAITVPGLKKKEIEEWLRTHRTPDARYLNKYVVLHTSGSSGTVGLFVYDQSACNWPITLFMR